ncbi:hypothetical protein [Barrientosiimonas humi]
MIESGVAFVVGAALAGLGIFAGINSVSSAELPAKVSNTSVVVYDG